LDYVKWSEGVEPAVEPAQEQPQPFEQQLDPHSVDFLLMTRAVNIVRRRYGIQPGDFSRWSPRHDREALNVLQALREGQPVQRNEYKEPPQLDPWATLLPRSSSR
jgi:hypothetical protein